MSLSFEEVMGIIKEAAEETTEQETKPVKKTRKTKKHSSKLIIKDRRSK
mgnify:CR=1 FL=1